MAEIKIVKPDEIEKQSFAIISEILRDKYIDPQNEAVLKRVIHTSADFDYYDNLVFSPDAVIKGIEAIKSGATIITDTNMAYSGINKTKLAQYGGKAVCFIADEDVAARAKQNNTTRATASMDKALSIKGPVIFAIGNAPTALVRLYEHITNNKLSPALIVGVPVGFVNVVESKELILSLNTSHIVAKGRKGGSNVAAAIINALLYSQTT